MAFKGDKCHGGKKFKERVTVMVCSIMDGSEKWPLLVIGKFKNPRCFKGIKKLPLDYDANPKAWMNSDLFSSWVQSFDAKMHRQRRNVLLIVDNCPAHPKICGLKSTELIILPPNCPSVIQPCDQGIIHSLKTRYRATFLTNFLHHIDSGSSADTFSINLLEAMMILKRAWDEVTQDTLKNCFRKAWGLQTDTDDCNDNSRDETVAEHLEELREDANPQDFVSVDSNVVVACEMSDQDIVSAVQSANVESKDDSDINDKDDYGNKDPTVTSAEARACLKKLQMHHAKI